jgi:uncharacterized protein
MIYGIGIIFFAALIQGLVGFGFALVSVPILILFLTTKIVVPIIMLLSALINIIIIIEAKKFMQKNLCK